MRTRSRIAFLVGLLVPLAACGDNREAAEPADARPVPPPPDDAEVMPLCEQYPIPVQAAPGAQESVQAALTALAPTATMTWRDNTATFSSITGLDLPLPGCIAGEDVTTQVFAALAAHPAVFQMDLTEWPTQEFFNCQFADGAFVSIGRHRLAGHSFAFDIFAYGLASIDGVMTMTNVFGTYLPVAPAGISEAMDSCTQLTASAAETTARATALQAATFELCAPTGSISYTPRANDRFELLADESWAWEEGTGQVLLRGQRTLRVTLDPSNYTPELMSSSARCPVTDPTSDAFTIGFDISFDLHTGEILIVKPGLDCIVC
jgi:hypothetical protein